MNSTSPVPRKYVHVEGHAEIEYNAGLDRLTLTFLDEHLDPINPQVPLIFSKKKDDTEDLGRLAIKFKNVHLIASLSEEGYNRYKDTLKKIDPLTEEWMELEDSNNSHDMNTTDPPSN